METIYFYYNDSILMPFWEDELLYLSHQLRFEIMHQSEI